MKQITITCLGSGGAFADVEQGNSAYLFEYGDHRLLLDCGTTVPAVLKERDIDPGSLTGILISHLHADHCGGLEHILYHRRFISQSPPVPLVMGRRTMHNWVTAMRAFGNGLEGHEYVDRSTETDHTPLDDWKDEMGGRIEQLGPICVRGYFADHGSVLRNMNCCSFRLDVRIDPGLTKKVFFSGDRRWGVGNPRSDNAITGMMESDLILHELELGRNSGSHTHYEDLANVTEETLKRFKFHHHSADITLRAALRDKGLDLVRKGSIITL
jgi:ribonuclease BN (tRNA processing enzyme)